MIFSTVMRPHLSKYFEFNTKKKSIWNLFERNYKLQQSVLYHIQKCNNLISHDFYRSRRSTAVLRLTTVASFQYGKVMKFLKILFMYLIHSILLLSYNWLLWTIFNEWISITISLGMQTDTVGQYDLLWWNQPWPIYWKLQVPWRFWRTITQRSASLISEWSFKFLLLYNALLCRKCYYTYYAQIF